MGDGISTGKGNTKKDFKCFNPETAIDRFISLEPPHEHPLFSRLATLANREIRAFLHPASALAYRRHRSRQLP